MSKDMACSRVGVRMRAGERAGGARWPVKRPREAMCASRAFEVDTRSCHADVGLDERARWGDDRHRRR
jgi:hypothetical protein